MIIGRELLTSLLGPCQHDASSGNPLVHEGAGWNVFQTHMYHRVLNLLGWEKKDHLDFALLNVFSASDTTRRHGNLIMYVSGQNKKRMNKAVIPSYQEVSISDSAYSSLAAYKTAEGYKDSIVNTCISAKPLFKRVVVNKSKPEQADIITARKLSLSTWLKFCGKHPYVRNGFHFISFVIVHHLVPNFKYFREKEKKKGAVDNKTLIFKIFDTVCGDQRIVELLDLFPDNVLTTEELVKRLQEVADSGIVDLLRVEGCCTSMAVYDALKNIKKKMMLVEKKVHRDQTEQLLRSQFVFKPQHLHSGDPTHHHFQWHLWSREKVEIIFSFLMNNEPLLLNNSRQEVRDFVKEQVKASLADTDKREANNSNTTEQNVVSVPNNKFTGNDHTSVSLADTLADTVKGDANNSNTTEQNVVSVPNNQLTGNDHTSVPLADTDKRDANISRTIQNIVVSVPNDGSRECNDNTSVSENSSLTVSTGHSFPKCPGNQMADHSVSAKPSYPPNSHHANEPREGNKSVMVSLDDTSSENTKDDAPSCDILFSFPLDSVSLHELDEMASDLTIARSQIASGPPPPILYPLVPRNPILKQDLDSLRSGAMLSNRVIIFFYNW